MMLLMGGHLANKPVVTDWPGLANDKLVNLSNDANITSGDLAITIDYRDVLSEILTNRLNNNAVDQIFPDFKPTPRGILTKG